MAKKALLTVDGTYRKVKKGLFTLDSVYRKVKKAYLTVGGVYRPCWAGGELVNFGEITPLTNARYDYATATVTGYALFAGGYQATDGAMSAIVEAYDANLTRKTVTSLSMAKRGLQGAMVAGCALFAGGLNGSNYYNNVDCYDADLTRTALSAMQNKRAYPSAMSTPRYAMFVNGDYQAYRGSTKTGDAYGTDLTRVTMPTTTYAVYIGAGASVGEHGLCSGGDSNIANSPGHWLSAVDCYDGNLSRSVLTSLSVGRNQHIGVSMEKYALFAGGQSGSGASTAVVDVYDESLARSSADNLSRDRQGLDEVVLEGTALVYGGHSYSLGGYTTNVDAYSEELIHTVAPPVTHTTADRAGATIGSYAILGAGSTLNAYTFA